MSSVTADPFDTAQLRAAVLDAWRASPTRFREDANVEEDYALGAYRDRLVVELAQNASDAARAAGVAGRLLLRADDHALTAANVGAPLDRAGVESLAAMRASSKEVGAVGRFGVGFAAALTVSDAPEVRSRDGGVRFDRSGTAELMRADPGLSMLVEHRKPPVLRLPFSADARPPEGYDTAVVLPWRDADARQLAIDALAAVDEVLLLSLPLLAEVVVEVVRNGEVERHVWQAERTSSPWDMQHDGQTSWWRWETIGGGPSEEDEETLPHEEVLRRSWTASVALPVTEDGRPVPLPASLARVVHAPTPTEEPWGLPVVAIGDFRLDPSRRHIAPGARTDAVAESLAIAYTSLVYGIAQDHGVAALPLVPSAALVGTIDHQVRERVRELLASYAWVPRARDGGLARPAELVALEPSEPGLVRVLAEHLLDLVDPAWVGDELRSLGLSTRPVHEVWDALAAVALTAEQWRAVYDEAAHLDPRALEGLPVPLVGGRLLRSARAAVVTDGDVDAADELAALGIDVVHPDAEHPLLRRLGAVPFSPASAFDLALVHRIDAASEDDPDRATAMITAAAGLLARSGVAAGELPALGDVPVRTDADGWQPASTVLLPGSVLDEVAARSAPRLASDLASAAPPEGWAAFGVLAALTAVTVHDVVLDPAEWSERVPDGDEWCSAMADLVGVSDPAALFVPDTTYIRGIDLVEGLGWADVSRLLLPEPVYRALTEPCIVLTDDGRRVEIPSPAAWWLRETPLLDGRCPVEVRLPGDERLAPFFPMVRAPEGVTLELLEAIGVHSTLDRWLRTPDGVDELLDALADPGVDISAELAAELYAQLTDARLTDGGDARLPDPPDRVRAIVDDTTAVVDADDVIVAVAPHHALVALVGRTPHVPGTPDLADALDLAVSDDTSCGAGGIRGTGVERPVPDLPQLAAHVANRARAPATYREHDELQVGDVTVDWWVTDDGELHTATVEGLARALAWASGQWSRRFEIAAALEQPESARALAVERLYDR